MTVRVHVRTGLVAAARWSSHLLLGGGLLMAGAVLWDLADAAYYQRTQADQFDAFLQAPPQAQPESPAPIDFKVSAAPVLRLTPAVNRVDPALVGRLEIPRLGLTAMVREGLDSSTLRKAVGHMPGSAAPGQPGNFVIAGHRDSFFRGLRAVATGDEIRVQTRAGVFRYRIHALSVVDPADTQAIRPTMDPVCTLVTCFPFDYIGPAPRRFIVRADLITP